MKEGKVLIKPHRPYSHYVTPMFIIHATDVSVTIRSDLGDVKIRRLDEFSTSRRVLYSCVSWDTLLLYGQDSLWTVRTWNGKISSMSYGETKIYPLDMPWDSSVPEFFTYINNRGIAAASINTISLNLWRTTLSQSVSFSEEMNDGEYLGLSAVTVGGRKEAIPGRYRRRVEYDISAAYPNALGIGMPSRLVPWKRTPGSALDHSGLDNWEGIARARVRIPPRKWGPIPVTIDPTSELTCYGYTSVDRWASVTLPLSELRMAQRFGADVQYDKVSVALPDIIQNPFADWLSKVVPELRAHSSSAGILGKLTANRLWSCFAISPGSEKCELKYIDGKISSTILPPDSDALAQRRGASVYVGAMVSSRVRQRVYTEGLAHFRDCVYVDTDGVIAKPTDTIPDGWRVKTEMRTVEVAAAQAIRYTCNDCLPPPYGHDGPHWTVAGASSIKDKSRLFTLMKNGGFVVANIGNVLPAQDMGRFGNATKAPRRSEAFAIFAEQRTADTHT